MVEVAMVEVFMVEVAMVEVAMVEVHRVHRVFQARRILVLAHRNVIRQSEWADNGRC